MRALLACVLLVATAGCVNDDSGQARVTLLDAPLLSSFFPANEELPGFHVGFEPEAKAAERAGMLSRVYDYAHNNATVRQTLAIGIQRMDSADIAREACAERALLLANSGPVERTSEGILIARQASGDPQSSSAFATVVASACEDLYLVWVTTSSTGAGPVLDVEGLLESMLDRVREKGA